MDKTRGMVVSRLPRSNFNSWLKTAPVKNKPRYNFSSWLKKATTPPSMNVPVRSIVNKNYNAWMKAQLELISKMPNVGPRVFRSKNNLSAVVNSARSKGGLELYRKFGGYYISGHGFCVRSLSKFRVPNNKAVLYISKASDTLRNNKMALIEQQLLRNNGRVSAFIQGSAKVTNLNYSGENSRLFLPGEEVYDTYIHLTSHDKPPGSILNSNYNESLKGKLKPPHSFGPSFGHIWKLPLAPGFSSSRNFNFNRNKNRIIWNIPGMLSNRTINLPTSERYKLRKEEWKISNIIKNGPPGLYIVGTCRESIRSVNLAGNSERSLSNTLKMLAENRPYFNNLRRANITDPTRGLLKTRNV